MAIKSLIRTTIENCDRARNAISINSITSDRQRLAPIATRTELANVQDSPKSKWPYLSGITPTKAVHKIEESRSAKNIEYSRLWIKPPVAEMLC
jgi:hypothetical protein